MKGGFCLAKPLLGLCHGAADVHSARTLWGVFDFERDGVSLAELIEHDVDESIGVKKHVLGLSFWGDKAETAVGEGLDDTIHRNCIADLRLIMSKIREVRRLF